MSLLVMLTLPAPTHLDPSYVNATQDTVETGWHAMVSVYSTWGLHFIQDVLGACCTNPLHIKYRGDLPSIIGTGHTLLYATRFTHNHSQSCREISLWK